MTVIVSKAPPARYQGQGVVAEQRSIRSAEGSVLSIGVDQLDRPMLAAEPNIRDRAIVEQVMAITLENRPGAFPRPGLMNANASPG
jgi:hypothetical protein